MGVLEQSSVRVGPFAFHLAILDHEDEYGRVAWIHLDSMYEEEDLSGLYWLAEQMLIEQVHPDMHHPEDRLRAVYSEWAGAELGLEKLQEYLDKRLDDAIADANARSWPGLMFQDMVLEQLMTLSPSQQEEWFQALDVRGDPLALMEAIEAMPTS